MGRLSLPRAVVAPLVLFVLVATACGGAGANPAEKASPTVAERAFPVTISAADGAVTIPTAPRRIVSLSPTATEMLFAIDAGPQVVAVDSYSNHPAEAPTTKLSAYEPNVEAIARYRPDLVVVSNDIDHVVEALGKLGVPVLLEPAAGELDDTYAQIEQLGAATGHVADAAELVSSMRSKIAAIVASAPSFDRPLTYYHELDQTYYSATSETFIGQLYGLLGLRNIADEAKGSASGYPQLSAEYIIRADPDLIFLADTKCCGQSPTTVSRRPGWEQISAVRDRAVFGLDDDIVSRWGPRVVDFLRTLVHDLDRVRDRVNA
jgi:iron complex transport system substrate-binding protein